MSHHEGPIELTNHSGTSLFDHTKGGALIKNVSGVVRLEAFRGNFQGEFGKGTLVVQADELQNFKVNAHETAVTLQVPEDLGAMVHLRTEKGRLGAPGRLRRSKNGRWTERRGQLKGTLQGNIKIVSKYGDIVIK